MIFTAPGLKNPELFYVRTSVLGSVKLYKGIVIVKFSDMVKYQLGSMESKKGNSQ